MNVLLNQAMNIYFDMVKKDYPDDLTENIYRLIIDLTKYSDSQPRDDHGRWTDGGSGDSSSSGGGSAKLTENEKAAMSAYISSESYVINEKLRSDIKLNDDEQKIVDNLDFALEKMPKYEGTVYRSLSSDMMNNSDEFWRLHQAGNTVRYKAYTSSSLEVYDETMDIQCIIKSKRGRNITFHNDNEKEILFRRNSLFFVTRIESNTIYMEEV